MSTLTITEKKKVASQLRVRYQKASKKQKGSILTEFIEITGYNHSYAPRSSLGSIQSRIKKDMYNQSSPPQI